MELLERAPLLDERHAAEARFLVGGLRPVLRQDYLEPVIRKPSAP
jgi:hypothetical protein